jgi:hypothetical protein
VGLRKFFIYEAGFKNSFYLCAVKEKLLKTYGKQALGGME